MQRIFFLLIGGYASEPDVGSKRYKKYEDATDG